MLKIKRTRSDILHGVIWQQILLFFFPVLFGTIFQQLYNTIDAIIVGNIVGKEALGAVGGSTGTIVNLIVGFLVGLTSGATVSVAQYYGKQDRERVHLAVSTGMTLALILGATITVIGYIITPSLLEFVNVPVEILDLSITYLRIYFLGMIPTMIYNTGASILRATGDSKRPLYFLIVSCFVNIILDILFVAVFHWGIGGAAIATIIAQIVSCIFMMLVFWRTDDSFRFTFKDLHINMPMLKQILAIGFPLGLQSSLYSFANLFVQSSINGYGTDVVAAYTAFGKIDALYWNASGAMGTAILTFTGQNFGAGNIDRVKKGVRVGILEEIILSILLTLVCYFGSPFLYRMFTSDANVISIGIGIMHFISPFWTTFFAIEIYANAMRGCGESFLPTLMLALGIGVYRIMWILFFPSKTIYEILVCYPISWILTSLLFIIYYYKGTWLKRSLIRREKQLSITIE